MTRVRAELADKKGIVVFNGALMIEKDWLSIANNNVFILDVSEVTQCERLIARGYSDSKIKQRLEAQLSTGDKIVEATKIADRDGYGEIIVVTNGTSDNPANNADYILRTIDDKIREI
jgi:dephospho-CoA kinase